MEPPNGSKHRPLENKVVSWGNYFLSSLSDFVEANFTPNPSDSIDPNYSNFSIGSGRVDEDKMLKESNLSGVIDKPDDAEIRNLKTEQKFFPPELSEGAANREIRNFESEKVNFTAKDRNLRLLTIALIVILLLKTIVLKAKKLIVISPLKKVSIRIISRLQKDGQG